HILFGTLDACASVRLCDGLLLVECLEHGLDDVRPVEGAAERSGREEIWRLIPASVDVPADQVFASGGSGVVTLGGPEHPALGGCGVLWNVNEQRQQFPALLSLVPADGAVGVCGNDHAAVR